MKVDRLSAMVAATEKTDYRICNLRTLIIPDRSCKLLPGMSIQFGRD
jgi:hypothetical protein